MVGVVDQQESSVEKRPTTSVVQPLNVVEDMDLIDHIDHSLQDQIKRLCTELRALARESSTDDDDDAKPKDDAANKGTGERKRGRKPTTEIVGPISVEFELPLICFMNNLDLDVMLATQSEERNKGENYAPRLTVVERLQNWTMQLSKREMGMGSGDVYYYHLPSGLRFRSKPDVIEFVLYEAPPPKPFVRKNKKSKTRRRLAKVAAIAKNVRGSAIMMIENSSDVQPQEMEGENKPMEGGKEEVKLENRMTESSASHPQEVEMEMEKNMVSDLVEEEGDKAVEVLLEHKKIESSSGDHPQEIEMEDKSDDPVENMKLESSTDDDPQEIEGSSSDNPQEVEMVSEGEKSGEQPLENEMIEESSSADHHQEIEMEEKLMSTEAMMEEFFRSGEL